MFIPCIVIVANAVTAGRLISYQRRGARYRPGVSFVAYSLIVCSGGQAIDTLFNGTAVSMWQAGFSVGMMVLVLRARGNVACITRIVI